MHKAVAHAKGIMSYLRKQSGKLVTLRVVHNMIQGYKSGERSGMSDADRVLAILDKSARMKRLFRAFPEAVLVDAVHATNTNRYKRFSFAVQDVFGKGQYVFHSLVESEEKPNLRMAVDSLEETQCSLEEYSCHYGRQGRS